MLASHLSQSHSTLVAGSLARKPATAKRDLSSIPGFLVTTSPRASPGGGGRARAVAALRAWLDGTQKFFRWNFINLNY